MEFSKRLLTNWGKRNGKFLLIYYDEKWFWGLLFHKTAKYCDDLPKNVVKAYCKYHISKTIGIVVVAIAFENSLENGVTAIKICFQRA